MAEFDHDLEAYFRYIQSVDQEKRQQGVVYFEGPLRKKRLMKSDAA